MTSLNPHEGGRSADGSADAAQGDDKAAAFGESVRMLDAVKIPESRKRMNMYPTSSPAACASG